MIFGISGTVRDRGVHKESLDCMSMSRSPLCQVTHLLRHRKVCPIK